MLTLAARLTPHSVTPSTATLQIPKFLPPRLWLDLAAVVLVFTAYTVTLWVALGTSLADALAGGIANTLPVVIFGGAARRIVRTRLAHARLRTQIVGHAMLCVAFSLLSYWLLIVLLGLVNSPSPLNFIVRSMISSGMAWQMLENVTTYAAVAAWGYAQAYREALSRVAEASAEVPAQPAPAAKPTRFLIRTGEELYPIDPAGIICIAGADDYAELSTAHGKRLVAMTLAEFEASLDPARFVRVHRSRIVNLDHVEKAEPAGSGRLLLHMDNGELVATSRTGAQALRSRAI